VRTILNWIAALVVCSAFFLTAACSPPPPPPPPPPPRDEWYTYRYDAARTGVQPWASTLSDPRRVGTLAVKWAFPTAETGVGAFRASPIVVNDTVFIGSTNGYFYALDAATGTLKWQYPKAGAQALLGACANFGSNGSYGAWGIFSSATHRRSGRSYLWRV
jgi:PQQ enzyme repeat